MKNFIKNSLALAIILTIATSCRKTEDLDVDFNKYNLDMPETNTDLDKWLNTNLLDPYNMKVIYRYNRYYYGDAAADVAPLKPENVRPMMQTVSDGYLAPYLKIAGLDFVQRTNPKEWVLYGSAKYQTDGSAIAGTAAGGRRVTLYGLNSFSLAPSFVNSRLYVIHHEFTHILNQTVAIPIDFEAISGGTYKQPWTLTSAATAKDNGFLGSYASGSPTEDYAETTATLLVSGQSYYDNYANTSNATAKSRLKLKESNVVNYFNTAFGIDFRKLQKEVQNYLKNTIKDPSISFGYWLNRNLYKSMTINLDNDVTYSTYGISDQFRTAYQTSKANVIGLSGFNLGFGSVKLNFTSATAMTMDVNFSQGTTNYVATYNFTMSVNDATGAVKFTLSSTAPTGNAALLLTSVQPLLTYLNNNNFIADWLPASYNTGTYTNFGGFYVSGTPANYFYGALGQ
ncbi:substrate import-associated zinc metallohydrolase lipoprotein [Pedobacter sp. BMA]|uniref:substrate import-associated zinc metallohydrolase lipoprotein n=1 Tax=Pedobacter sp. BMA TaxID=1663685 RepID=UPI00064980D9|nr:substrate import-associated zinc metallohydrolase lipoprotein [Pedobacter sp. BMA]KLT66201.1 hypothetical protein AB669_08595 [Pedobacter sp. BMA]